VAQVGRRLAEYVIANQTAEAITLGVDAEIVEAACLAHDLGHPPFGHLGEQTLNDLVIRSGDQEGFEGNAQSFRVLTKLAVRFKACDGLDLTRATMAATIKYPWRHDSTHPLKSRKWGFYQTEQNEFDFARLRAKDETKTAEAELMDWADDIAYSIHDLEDFHRCRLIPWPTIFSAEGRKELVDGVIAGRVQPKQRERQNLISAHVRLAKLVDGTVGDLINDPYEATKEQRQAIRLMTSTFIGRYVQTVKLRVPRLGESCLDIPEEILSEVAILKQITRRYVISTPALLGQQHGQSRLLKELFEDLFPVGSERYLPRRFEYMLTGDQSRGRRVADCISGLTEAETIGLHRRLRGHDSGSVLDPIVR
jgi:dGTPase